MKSTLRRGAVTLSMALLFGAALAQQQPGDLPPVTPPGQHSDVILPSGKSQHDEILKAEHQENVKDAARLADLADELKQALDREDRFVFSLTTIKKTEEIEKLAKKIRSRMRHD